MRFDLPVLAFVFALIAASVSAQKPGDSYAGQGYLIGPGDILSIKALGEPTFNVEALTVDEDGAIMLPFSASPIVAKCKTERGLQSEVVKAWSKYLKNPQISLHVSKRNSRPPVSVLGEVRKQEQFDLTRRVYLLELISAAGGVSERSGGVVQVFRTRPPMCGPAPEGSDWAIASSGGALDVPSRMYSLAALNSGNKEANPEILPGDIIVVPKAAPVYVIGEVIKPGEIDMPQGGLPLTQAIAMASGANREAKTKSVKIYRKKSGSPDPEVLAVNYDQIRKGEAKDVMLQPFDIVEIGKAPKSFMDYVIEFATGVPGRIPIPIRPI